MPANTEEIKIMAEPQMDPNVCRFVVDRSVYDGMVNCKSRDMAKGSPLLEALFDLPGISQVMVTGPTITIAKISDSEWVDLGPNIGSIIRESLSSNAPAIAEDINKDQPTNKELMAKVQAIFDEEINPGIASHGGSVEIIDVKGTTLFVTMSGGCQGCASATYTLRHGIEQILREKAPEVTDIVDVTDHSAGTDPYY